MGYLDRAGLSHFWGKVIEYVGAHSGGVPKGAILAWSGTADDIPTGWQICDGTNGTPDLRDKFVLGAGETHPVGETGGSEEVTLTPSQMPKHAHSLTGSASNQVGSSRVRVEGDTSGAVTITSSTTGGSQPHPNMPPYYALLFIQKMTAD